MKPFFYILLFSIGVTLTATTTGFGQDLPMACAGTVEKYWVKGENGKSTFIWTITDNVGNTVPSSFFTFLGQMRGDTIQITWDSTLPGGIYTFSVVEHYETGLIGEPWDSQFVMLNSPTINIPFEGVPSSVAVCYGDQAALDPGLFSSYLWQDNSTNRIYYTGEAGTYQVRLTDQNQSCSYNEIEAKINPLPYVWLGNDTVLFGDQSIILDVFDPKIQIYQWSTGSILTSVTVNGQVGDQKIWVKVTDENTCQNSDTILISSADPSHLRIPAAFTPNGDGINDKWYFPAPAEGSQQDLYPYFDEIVVRVFNRWGKLVWESNNDFIAWDGKDLKGENLPMDSYHYLIRLKAKGKTFEYKGSVTIIR